MPQERCKELSRLAAPKLWGMYQVSEKPGHGGVHMATEQYLIGQYLKDQSRQARGFVLEAEDTAQNHRRRRQDTNAVNLP